ncbi:helix-turn-helix domain-containing protein [Streptomyces sp. NRRL B-3648]|uniref:helix-turn-helix domain-containing protein n=1 Tax=Streptomyces sp. NRRL B-3648 TaxID=1519493 RepID=UPI0006B05A7B|nr:helix-turn-helix transcriptional regulator [Streptomyces sp. NRRL B-3648]
MGVPPAGPVADFCAELHRLVRACGVSQTEIGAALRLSGSSVSELLSGRRRRVPDWNRVRLIVALCADRRGAGSAPPAGMTLDTDWWRARHAELERTAEAAAVPRPVPGPPADDPVPPHEPGPPADVPGPGDLDAGACVDMDVRAAVLLLAGDRQHAGLEMLRQLNHDYDEPSVRRMLAELLDGYPRRVRASRGLPRGALLQAARVVTAACAVRRHVPGLPAEGSHLVQGLANGSFPAYAPAGTDPDGHPDPAGALPWPPSGTTTGTRRLITDSFHELTLPLAARCPEFALAAGLPSARVRSLADTGTGVGLAGLGALLDEFAGTGSPSAAVRARLRAPIASLDAPGPRLPSLGEGYVDPRFRLSRTTPGDETRVASDKWWEQQEAYEGIDRFLAAHLLSLPALLTPLVVLGHPGAGKSLLTRLLAARLPAAEFRPLRVELRHTPPLGLQEQLEHTLRRDTGRPWHWPDWAEEEPGALPVVLLDGFDELLQAGAQSLGTRWQWNYLTDVAAFQLREAAQGRPLIVLVTSRTVVADRAQLPEGSLVLRLEPFGPAETDRWLSVWNTVNHAYFTQRDLLPLSPETVLRHGELTAQPLLLLMLALYDAADNALHRLTDADFSRTELYDRLLTEFVRRQVDKDGALPPAEQAAAVERELHRLSVVALGMFQRGAQALGAADADRDLAALDGAATGEDRGGGSDLLFGRFFFVHEAHALVAEQRLRSYEFMHATFGEHLTARLIGQAVRELAESGAGDDGLLYALLSFAPLTDRAQVLENVRDLLARRAPGGLVDALAGAFRAADWEPEGRTLVGHAPMRLTATYRNSVYQVNLLLIAVAVAGEVWASRFLAPDDDVADGWRRHAFKWRSQLSGPSWKLFTGTLTPVRRRRSGGRPDLRLRLQAQSADDRLDWVLGSPDSEVARYAGDDEFSPDAWARMHRRITFTGDPDAEILLHAVRPLLQSMPGTLLTYRTEKDGRLRSAAQALLTLVAQPPAAALRDKAYATGLRALEGLPSGETEPYLEALVHQLARDAPLLPDDSLAAHLRRVRFLLDKAVIGPALRTHLSDCLFLAAGRPDPALEAAVAGLHQLLVRTGTSGSTEDVRLAALVAFTQAARSSSTWRDAGMPCGAEAAGRLDRILRELDLPAVAARRPSVLVAVLRAAIDLGLDDWLSVRAPELLRALPREGFGLLRPSDLPPLRAALPPGAHASEFAAVEARWR